MEFPIKQRLYVGQLVIALMTLLFLVTVVRVEWRNPVVEIFLILMGCIVGLGGTIMVCRYILKNLQRNGEIDFSQTPRPRKAIHNVLALLLLVVLFYSDNQRLRLLLGTALCSGSLFLSVLLRIEERKRGGEIISIISKRTFITNIVLGLLVASLLVI